MAQTIGDLVGRVTQQATSSANRELKRRGAPPVQTITPAAAPVQSITPVVEPQQNWFERQATAPWIDQAGGVAQSVGNAAKEGGGLLKKIGGGIWDAVGPDTEAWGDIFSGDATLGDWASAGLDVATIVPGVGLAGRAAGKLALKGAVKAAGKEGLEHAAKTAAKGSAIRTPAAQKSLKEMLDGGLQASKSAGAKKPGIVRRQFTDPNLAASKSRKSAGASKAAASTPSAAVANPLQKAAGNASSRMLNVQRKLALENQGKTVNKALGRNKARLGLTSTSKTSTGLKLGAMSMRNSLQDLLAAADGADAAGPEGPYNLDLGDGNGPQQVPGSMMIGYRVGGRGGAVQPMTVAEAAAQIAAGSLQSGGSWVRLS